LLLPHAARGQLVPPSPGIQASSRAGAEAERKLDVDGYLRVRSDVFYNLDLDRGPTPSGDYLFHVPASNPKKQVLESADTRLRLEPFWQISPSVRVMARIDILDNVVLGSTPKGFPRNAQTPMVGGTTAQLPPVEGKNAFVDSIVVKRAWGEVLLPFGLLAVGRQGALINWGTGFFINSSSHLDADGNDAADRVMFATSLVGHLWLVAFDWSAVGPVASRGRPEGPYFNIDRADDVRTWSFGVANYDTEATIRRKLAAGAWSINYGVIGSYRRQSLDVPAYYGPGGFGGSYGPSDYLDRDLDTVTGDVWLRLQSRTFRLEVEGAVIYSRVGDSSLDASVEIRPELTSLQYGGVVQTSWRPKGGSFSTGVEVGMASGDAAPGFGARPPLDRAVSRPGDLDGPQFALPGDTEVNNFRFHPDYFVDLILWRRIIGTVTDAFYLRPWVRWESSFGLRLEGVAIASFAMNEQTPPGGERPLGVEVDVLAAYRYDEAFEVRMGFGTLFPLAGLSNNTLGLDAEPAVTLHTILAYLF
jgi:uncharacterized protein (TIGR04551 family)